MDVPINNAILVTRRWSNHADHSGYDQLAKYLGQPLTAKALSNVVLPDSLLWRLNDNMHGYDRLAVALELAAAQHMAAHRNYIYHFIYGDNSYHFLGRLNGWRGHRVVATFHHPPSKLGAWMPGTEAVARLSAAVIVATSQYAFFRRALRPQRIVCIPHAVDTSYFVPPPAPAERDSKLCLFVGSHLRDFRTLRALIEDARVVAPQLRFIVVLHKMDAPELAHVVGNFTIRSGVTDEELLLLYQRSAVLVQPLLDSTANNAVLEAMSCGLPIVATDVGGIQDYVDDRCARLVPPFRSDLMLEAILELASSNRLRSAMSLGGRCRALAFGWQPIAVRMRELYASVLNEPS